MENKTKSRVQAEQQIFYNLVQIVELFPQYTIAQHLSHILRKKGDLQDPYFWSDENLLKKFEKYHDELKEELATINEEDV